MKRQCALIPCHCQWALLIALLAALLVGSGNVYAQGGSVMLNTTIDGGGGSSAGGQFSLGATIGQPDAGQMAGGTFTLIGGYWTPLGLEPTGEQPEQDFTLVMPFLMRQQQ